MDILSHMEAEPGRATAIFTRGKSKVRVLLTWDKSMDHPPSGFTLTRLMFQRGEQWIDRLRKQEGAKLMSVEEEME